MSKECSIYIIANVKKTRPIAPVKVGISKDVEKRLSSLQTASSTQLVLVATFLAPNSEAARQLERAFHVVMEPRRQSGEWFDVEPFSAVRLMCENLRACFESIASDDAEYDAMLWASGVQDNEEKLRKLAARSASLLNDNERVLS